MHNSLHRFVREILLECGSALKFYHGLVNAAQLVCRRTALSDHFDEGTYLGYAIATGGARR